MMKALLNNSVVAEAATDDLVRIEGNWYFPPSAVVEGALTESPTQYTCAWKGDAQYFNINVEGGALVDGAWSYPKPHRAAIERVGTDFSGYVAFDRAVTVVEA